MGKQVSQQGRFMSGFRITSAFAALMLVAACSTPPNLAGGSGGAGAGGGVGDPTSPAYFQAEVGDRIFFAVDESSLSGAAQEILSAQAAWLQTNPSYAVIIEGHADERGTREYNLALGARRANAAYEFLISQGIAASRLRIVSFGKERPQEICSSEQCYAVNRRAVTVIATGSQTGV